MSSRITYDESVEKSRTEKTIPDDNDSARTVEFIELGPNCHCMTVRRNDDVLGLDFYHRRTDNLACYGWIPLEPHSGPDGWVLNELNPLTISPSILCSGKICGDFHGFIRAGKWENC